MTDEPLAHGPLRRAPEFYAGETYGRHRIQHADVERHGNGVLPGKRDKFMRRLIRRALKTRFSKVERGLKLPRAMRAQAVEIAKEEGKSMRWARRILAQELALHQAVYVPEDLRKVRTMKRIAARKGQKDAIAQLVDRMADARR